MSKRRIRCNIWGNWNGYEGRKRVMSFGTDERGANLWLKDLAAFKKERDDDLAHRASFLKASSSL